jgi:hypothetical protein
VERVEETQREGRAEAAEHSSLHTGIKDAVFAPYMRYLQCAHVLSRLDGLDDLLLQVDLVEHLPLIVCDAVLIQLIDLPYTVATSDATI